MIAWLTPLDPSRETWDDLIATGAFDLIRDADLRIALSAYYNRLERVQALEAEWNAQLDRYETHAYSLRAPARRFAALATDWLMHEVLGTEDCSSPPPGIEDLQAVLAKFRKHPQLHALFAQERLVRLACAFVCDDLLRQTTELLHEAESAA